jgi:hypothetical protein
MTTTPTCLVCRTAITGRPLWHGGYSFCSARCLDDHLAYVARAEG